MYHLRSTDQSSHLGLRRCFRELTTHLGHVPLRASEVRLDPALFKDAVSIARKKYRRLESGGAAGGDGPGSAARRRHQA